MNLDDVLRTAVDQISRAIEPSIPDPLAIRRRARQQQHRRLLAGGSAAAAVLAALAVGALQIVHPNRDVPPAGPSPTTSTQNSAPGKIDGMGAVWYAAGVLHDDQQSFPAVGQIATNLAVVASGVLYGDETGQVIYQRLDGSSTVVGHNAALGPAGNSAADIAVWFERARGHNYLVVYDLQIAKVVARANLGDLNVAAPDSMVGRQQPPVLFVGDAPATDGVVYFKASGSVWRYDWAYGANRPVRVGGPVSRAIDVAGDTWAVVGPRNGMTFERSDGTVLSSYAPLEPDGSLSPDGHYYVGYSRGRTVVVDTRTGSARPLHLGARSLVMGVTWARGNTVVMQSPDLSSGGHRVSVLACDAVSLICERVSPPTSMQSLVLPVF